MSIKVGEHPLDHPQFSDLLVPDLVPGSNPLRVTLYHKGLRRLHLAAVPDLDKMLYFCNRQPEWFLAQHMLTGLHSLDGPFCMQMVRQRIIHGLNTPICQHLFI